MSKFIQGFIGVAEIAIGFFVPGAQALIFVGAGQLLNVAAQLLLSPHRPPVSPTDINYTGTLEPRRILYGKHKMGGMHVIPPMTSGDNNDMLHMVTTLAGYDHDALADVYLPSA